MRNDELAWFRKAQLLSAVRMKKSVHICIFLIFFSRTEFYDADSCYCKMKFVNK